MMQRFKSMHIKLSNDFHAFSTKNSIIRQMCIDVYTFQETKINISLQPSDKLHWFLKRGVHIRKDTLKICFCVWLLHKQFNQSFHTKTLIYIFTKYARKFRICTKIDTAVIYKHRSLNKIKRLHCFASRNGKHIVRLLFYKIDMLLDT